jgi:predicted transcriptional regulator of viral defense system
MQALLDIASKNNGFITVSQAENAGIARSRLSEMVRAGGIERVERGVYRLADSWEDEFLVAQLRFSKGIFSDGTALFLHDFTDRTPERLTMTFPRSYNGTRPRSSGIVVRTCRNDIMEFGMTTIRTPAGNTVKAYDLERTLCDVLRGQTNIDVQVVNPAMKSYVRSPRRDILKLLEYSQVLGVERKVRQYLEVLL